MEIQSSGNSFKQNSIIAKEILETEIQSFSFQLIWKNAKYKQQKKRLTRRTISSKFKKKLKAY